MARYRSAIAALVALVAVSACASSPSNSPQKSSEYWCGQKLTQPAFLAAFGMQRLGPIQARPAVAPAASVLPPRLASDSGQFADWSDLLVLSSDCTRGLVVTVTNSPYVRTVATAHDTKGTGLTALLLGRVKASPGAVTVTVTGYMGTDIVGQSQLRF